MIVIISGAGQNETPAISTFNSLCILVYVFQMPRSLPLVYNV